ncbi:MAG: DNA oxidative demethylase AlkB [Castellaniella sp.]|uniref:DNA oxidative demethylase AlkB n=1 Tax=Castellaniella sp. TaxID=1955812 RepID=UPI003C762D40
MTLDLFGASDTGTYDRMGSAAGILRGFALPDVDALLPALADIQAASPFRHMITPGGFTMSVALSNCETLGWTSDRFGYRYSRVDPSHGRPWPAMPAVFLRLAQRAAAAAGFDGFAPDACLINRYVPGSRLSLHQDKNEVDSSAPIVSVSLGMAAVFVFGGHARTDKCFRTSLLHGDVAVWGGEDRMRYHGVLPMVDAPHPLLGSQRINLTFRKAA